MIKKTNDLLLQKERDLARCVCPAVLVDRAWHIRYRNRKAAPLICRRRRLAPLLAEARDADAALFLRPMDGKPTLVWIAAREGEFRKILFLRSLNERETALMEQWAKAPALPEGATDREETGWEPLDLLSFLETAEEFFPGGAFRWRGHEGPEETLWAPPEAREVILRLLQLLVLIGGPSGISVGTKRVRGEAVLSFSFRDEAGMAEDLADLLSSGGAGERAMGLGPLLAAFLLCRDADLAPRLTFLKGEGLLEISLPVSKRLPTFFFQGRRKRRGKRR